MKTCPSVRSRRLSGFTLIETTVVVAILAVILAIAVPNFTQWLRSARLTAQANDLVADLLFARAEAASRGVQAIVCSSTDGAACATADNWATGRIVSLKNLGAASASVSKASSALSGGNTLTGIDGSGAALTQIIFNPYGGIIVGSNALPFKLKLCASSSSAGRLITLGANGRPNIEGTTCP